MEYWTISRMPCEHDSDGMEYQTTEWNIGPLFRQHKIKKVEYVPTEWNMSPQRTIISKFLYRVVYEHLKSR